VECSEEQGWIGKFQKDMFLLASVVLMLELECFDKSKQIFTDIILSLQVFLHLFCHDGAVVMNTNLSPP